MKHRKLRIAWSVGWGVVAVLLCVLWVRSYWWVDRVGGFSPASEFSLMSIGGFVGVNILHDLPQASGNGWQYTRTPYKPVPSTVLYRPWWRPTVLHPLPGKGTGIGLRIPIWIVAAILICFAIAPWLRFRFSLRTLLIATTLIAVVLGIIVWVSRGG